jgi:5-methylcytosine-specific restriction enzyme subunit McrC
MKTLTLIEYETAPGVALAPEELTALQRVPDLRIEPSRERPGAYDLTPGSTVGAVRAGDCAVEIRPKIGIERVLFLIAYALDPSRWNEQGFDFTEANSLLEAVIPGFVAQVGRALRRGVLQGYRIEEAALLTVRGGIRFDDQIRRRYGRVPPIEVRFDEFSEDIEGNRLIKAAVARLSRIRIRSAEARAMLRRFDLALQGVALVEYSPRQLPDIQYTRLNEHYRPAVELSKRILRSTSFELAHGRVRASTFLVNMNAVFEDFVVIALREALGLSERTFPQGARSRPLALDTAGKVHLKPDLSWWEGNRCVFVGDVKYKRIKAAGIKHPDLYQLLAYTVATRLPAGLLIYAEGEGEPARHEVVELGKMLEVASLDVSGRPEEILQSVWRLAQRIKSLRAHYSLSLEFQRPR